MPREITRRDFLNAALLGAGALLLDLPAPLQLLARTKEWDGYGGVGDYAGSHGNTEADVRAAHKVRDGFYTVLPDDVIDTGERFDLIVIGGGISGLGAAFHFSAAGRGARRCLVLDNHALPGGVAKRNEFVVNGHRLIGPQGSNSFVAIDNADAPGYDIYAALGLPEDFTYQKPGPGAKKLRFDTTNYGFMLWQDDTASVGYFFEDLPGKWAADIWKDRLRNTPLPDKAKQDLLRWRGERKSYFDDGDVARRLDTMTYKAYLENVMGVSGDVAAYVDPVLACSVGLGADAISAFAAYQVSMPGFQGLSSEGEFSARRSDREWHSFPGGNDGISRHFIKRLIPGAIAGRDAFDDILNRPFRFEAFDRQESPVRLRLGALAVRVEHDGPAERAEQVLVTYVKEGKIYRAKARGVVMANGSWVTRRIVPDLPEDYKAAYRQFSRSPLLVVNVAVTNWRFLHKLGITACRWFEGFGFSCNIRRPMTVGSYRPPLDPDKPALITFYVPFYYPGLPAREQGIKGRTAVLSTSYADYERRIIGQMVRLFGSAGFDPRTDIAGIVLNRWGHAFVNPQPGFYFGRDGAPAPRDVIRKRFGRVAFAHSELNGHQHWLAAAEEGRRAAAQIGQVL